MLNIPVTQLVKFQKKSMISVATLKKPKFHNPDEQIPIIRAL